MNDKLKLSQASLIVTLGILLSLITVYVPILSILTVVIPVPYAIIGTLTNNKYSILSLIATFIILTFSVNPIYSTSISVMSVLPGLAIGFFARECLKEGSNKFEPIYMGTIAVVISTIVFYIISNAFFGTDMIADLINIIRETLDLQMKTLQSAGIDLGQGFEPEKLVDFMANMIPTMLFLQGIIIAFIIYYFEVMLLRRIRKTNLEIPKLREFYLPGNAVTVSLILYLVVLFIDLIGIKIHTELIIMNLQLVFSFMFMIQGMAVALYYIRKWFKQQDTKKVFISGFILYVSGFMGISFIGMLDSVIDFRKVRSYKSI